MKKIFLFSIGVAALLAGCRKSNDSKEDLRNFVVANLVDNNGRYGARHQDPTLINAWGLAFSPTGIAWVNSNGGWVSEVYTAEGAMLRPPVRIPTPTDTMGGNPTGIVFAGGKGFRLSNGGGAIFLFVTVGGVLAGWNGAAGNNALRIKDLSATSAFTGLAIASWGGKDHIYATDFKRGKVIVWDTAFTMISMPFHDPAIPAGYHPFNIQAVAGWLFVTYALVGPTGADVKGPGHGYVSIFKPDGSFVSRFASAGPLNSPWGITAAGKNFLDAKDLDEELVHLEGEVGGEFTKFTGIHLPPVQSNKEQGDLDSVILVGNFGDGRINAYGLKGKFLGQLKSHFETITVDGLWALSFAPATSMVDKRRLYFTAGPNDQKNGLFGYLIKQ